MPSLFKSVRKTLYPARGLRRLLGITVLMLCIGLPGAATVLHAQQGMGRSYGALLQGITPEQRKVLEKLTPEQRQTLKEEVIKNGGVLTPELINKLKAQAEAMTGQKVPEGAIPSPQGAAPASAVTSSLETQATATTEVPVETEAQLQENITVAEEEEDKFEKNTSREVKIGEETALLRRFGLGFFTPSRKRILTVEDAISKGEIPSGLQSVLQKDALAGFIGPLDMVTTSVNASIPPQYVLNPGDQITVYYWGDLIELTALSLALDDRGAVSLPKGGRLVARGMSLPQFQKAVQDQLQRELSKTVKVIATMDKLKSIQVLISGEAFRPGTYSVSAVTTLFNALYAAGGPNGRGSLRDIKLVRGNKTITVDFYEFLMNGDSKADYPLQSGDTILFGRAEKLASIAGEVNRPAVYELKTNETLKDLVRMAEGIKPSGLSNKVHVQSLVPHLQRAVVDVDMSKTGPAADHEIYDGDLALVEPIIDEILNKVTLAGDVKVSGVYELKPKMRVADLFNEVNQPWGEAYLERADVIRLDKDRKTTTIIPVNLGKALQKDPDQNIELVRFDQVVVYSKWDVKFYPERKVVIRGSVQKPETYERSDGMRILDLLIKAGNVMPDTYMERADLIRYNFESDTYLTIPVNLKKLYSGVETENILLTDKDTLRVYDLREATFIPPHEAEIHGNVQRPGTYTRSEGMRLRDLLVAAGGVLPGSSNEAVISKARSYYSKANAITISLERLMKGDETQNIPLDDEDIVMIRENSDFFEKPQWVELKGEVKFPGKYPILKKEYRLSELIQQAGGLTNVANPQAAVFLRRNDNLPSTEQRSDVQAVDKVINALNKIDYQRQSARNILLLRKELESVPTGEPTLAPASGTASVISSGLSNREAAAIVMGPPIAQSAGQVTGSIMGAFTPGTGVASEARTLTVEQLAQSTRVIINLEKGIAGDDRDNIVLMNGDSLTVPVRMETASVIGAVMNPVTIHIRGHQKLKHVIKLAGGYTDDANKDSVVVSRANGAVLPADEIDYVEDGDIVYVPTKVLTTEIITTTDKIINAVKFTLATAASVLIFLALIH